MADQPGIPEIQDEAADTPMWVPLLGLGLFMAAALWMVLSSSLFGDEEVEEPEEPPAAVAAADEGGEEAPAE